MFKIFLSHNSADKPQVENIAHRLREEGFDLWLDKWDLIAGEKWQEGLERGLKTSDVCLIFIGTHGQGPWHEAEMRVALNRNITQQGLRVIPVFLPDAPDDVVDQLPDFLQAYNGVRFHSLEDGNAFHKLIAGIREEKPGPDVDVSALENPYRGLEYFDIEHAPFFFGRDQVVQRLLELIEPANDFALNSESQKRFLAIIGASGSGKSSIARAGLLATLGNGGIEGSEDWPQLIFTPGKEPLESLAVALNAELKTRWDTAELIEKFRANPLQLHHLGLEFLHAEDRHKIVLLVDQFEEVFTLCESKSDRDALIANLLHAAEEPTGKVIVIITLRADFYSHCTAYPELSRYFEVQQRLLNPMSEDELRGVIEAPARKVGCALEEGLVDVILADAQRQPGTLPLLEYALMRLWEQRTSRVLRLRDYQAFGGLAGALEQRANELYQQFPEAMQEQCRLVFRRLVQPGEGTTDTRRRARLEELGDSQQTQKVVQTLASARLLTTQEKDGTAFVEVSHEALIREWSQLQEWIEEDRAQLRLQHQVSSAAHDWVEHGREESWLLSGARLAGASEWIKGHAADANELERELVDVSEERALAKKREEARLLEEKAELEKQQRLTVEQIAHDQKKSLTLSRWMTVLMAILGVVLFVATYFAVQSESNSKMKELQANFHLAKVFEEKANSAFDRANNIDAGDIQRLTELRHALLYVFEAQRKQIPEGENAVSLATLNSLSAVDARWLMPERKHTAALNLSSSVNSITYSPDGKVIASGLDNNMIILWDTESGEMLKTLKGNIDFVKILTIDYSPNGKVIASGTDRGIIRLWDVKSGEILKTLQAQSDSINSLSFSPDGKVIASAVNDNTVRLWDVESGEMLTTLKGHMFPVKTLSYSPDGKIIASGSDDGDINLWDSKSGKILKSLQGYNYNIRALAYSPDGKSIVSGSDDNILRLWDVESGKLVKTLQGHYGVVQAVTYSPDGKVIASGSDDNTVRLWDAESGEILKTLQDKGNGWIRALAYSPDGKVIASGSFNTISLWKADSDEALQGFDTIRTMAYRPDGKVIALGLNNETISLRDADSGETLENFQTGDDSWTGALAYSPDGKVIAFGANDNSIHLRSTKSGETLQILQGHEKPVWGLAYSPDGSVVASGAFDNTIRLWGAKSGEILAILKHDNPVYIPTAYEISDLLNYVWLSPVSVELFDVRLSIE